jgi:hypothetical protein
MTLEADRVRRHDDAYAFIRLGNFLDTAQYVVKSSSAGTKAVPTETAGGYKIFTTKDGSKAFARFEQTRGLPDGSEGTFQFIEGAGKLEGIKGGGTYRVWVVSPGLLWDRLEGEYEIKR